MEWEGGKNNIRMFAFRNRLGSLAAMLFDTHIQLIKVSQVLLTLRASSVLKTSGFVGLSKSVCSFPFFV